MPSPTERKIQLRSAGRLPGIGSSTPFTARSSSLKPVSLAWTWKIASPSARTQASGSIPCQNRWEGSKLTPITSPALSRSRSIEAVL